MSRTLVKTLRARAGTLINHKVQYTGWDTDLDRFVAKRLEDPRPTKVQAIEWLAVEPLLAPEFSLLDLGCGPGVFARMVHASPLGERVRYTGLDQSEQALEHARRTLPSSYTFVRSDALREGLPEGQFDVIVINEVVEHTPHYKEMIGLALARRPKVLVITTFAVLPGESKDRFLWHSGYACYMNNYSFGRFHEYLRRQAAGVPIKIADFGTKADSSMDFPSKALLLFYLPLGARP
jgi:SAM-dependent methyltransferase